MCNMNLRKSDLCENSYVHDDNVKQKRFNVQELTTNENVEVNSDFSVKASDVNTQCKTRSKNNKATFNAQELNCKIVKTLR